MVQENTIKVKKEIKSSSLRLFNLKNKVVFQTATNDKACTNNTKASANVGRRMGDLIPSKNLRGKTGVDEKHGSYARYLAAKVQNSIKNC